MAASDLSTLARISALGRFGELGLDRIRRVLDRLGGPDQNVRAVQITGTNGKGSTAAMTASIFRAAGRDVGLFISPHLSSPYERIQRNGVPISADELDQVADSLWPYIDVDRGQERLTEFEVWTVLAAAAFARWGVDIAVVEAGLGARYDATSALRGVVASAITSVALDHTDRLGKDVATIARDKAGCIRKGRSVVLGELTEDALREVQSEADRREARVLMYGRDLQGLTHGVSLEGTHASLRIGERVLDTDLALIGAHQAGNAAVACALALEVDAGLTDDVLRRGLGTASWPGRFEVLRRSPPLVLDGAHNPHGTAALAEVVQRVLPQPRHLVLGMLRDRDPRAVLEPLQPLFEQAIFTLAPSPRALPPEEIAVHWRSRALTEQDPMRAMALAHDGTSTVVLAGSLYLIGEVRPQLLAQLGRE